jgi:hypothetical protein
MHTRIPSLALSILLAIIASSHTSYAGASNRNGNPFGNGTFFQTTGTFSSVIRGQNLSGTMLFSTGVGTNSGGTNSSGSCVISYLGSPDGATAPGVYSGNANGMWDPSSGSIRGQFWGGYTRSGTNSTTIYPEIYNTANTGTDPSGNQFSYFPYPVQLVTNVLVNGVVVTYTNTIYVAPMGSNSFQDSVFMNGSFDGSVQNNYPNQTFSASGAIVIQQLYPQQQGTNADPAYSEGTTPVQMASPLTNPVTVQGIRISDNYSSFATISNSIPYTFTTYMITNFPPTQ